MPRKLYPGPRPPFCRTVGYVKTGAYRPPRKGEYYLEEGALPEVYMAMMDFTTTPCHIMRPATPEESRCRTCGQPLPFVES